VLCALDDNLNFPLQAQVMGEPVEVIGLDDRRSSLRKGIVTRVRKGGREYSVGLAGLTFIAPDPTSAEWLAMYRSLGRHERGGVERPVVPARKIPRIAHARPCCGVRQCYGPGPVSHNDNPIVLALT
jgi:hypothetical protein